jgi:hypothetical protein
MARALAVLVSILALSSAPAVVAIPPPAVPVLVFDDGSGGCFLHPTPVRTVLGQFVHLTNNDDEAHSVDQQQSFWSITPPGDGDDYAPFHAAGAYDARCDAGAYLLLTTTTLKAPGSPPASDFRVRWADGSADDAWTYDVQYRVGDGAWQSWYVTMSLRSRIFEGLSGQTYRFRARATNPEEGGGTTGWSPAKKVTT